MLELMITLMIVGILAAVGSVMYGKYSNKVKVSEGFQMLDVLSKAQVTYFITNKEFRYAGSNPMTYVSGGGGKYILPRPVGTIGDYPSWKDLGTPIPIGTQTYFEYQAMPGKTDAAGNNVNRGTDTSVNTTQKLLYAPTFGGTRWVWADGSKQCDQYSAADFIHAAGKSQYNWVLLMAFANLNETLASGNLDHCTQLFRVVDTNEQGRARTNAVVQRYLGE